MLQSKCDTKYIALLLIASHAKGQRKIAATADKKPFLEACFVSFLRHLRLTSEVVYQQLW